MAVPITLYKSGGYSIPALTSQTFSFWWGDEATGNEYFDVSISPDPKIPNMIPLIVEQETIGQFDGSPRQPIIFLTLRNENNFAINFTAHHVLIVLPG